MPGPALAVGGPSNITYWGRSRRSSTDRFAISRSFQNSSTRVSSSGKLTLLDTGLNIFSLISLAIHSTSLLPVFNRHSRASTRESIPPLPPVIPAEAGIHPLPRRVALPGAWGPLTLRLSKGRAGGGPVMPAVRGYPMPYHPIPPVIPRLREESRTRPPHLSPIGAQQKIPPQQGRDTTRGTTLIVRLRRTFSSGHEPSNARPMPSPRQRGATPATPTDRLTRFSGGGSGGIFGAGLRACFHRTRLADRSVEHPPKEGGTPAYGGSCPYSSPSSPLTCLA